MEVGQKFDQNQTTQVPFDKLLTFFSILTKLQAVQTDPTFVRQIGQKKSRAKVNNGPLGEDFQTFFF